MNLLRCFGPHFFVTQAYYTAHKHYIAIGQKINRYIFTT